MSVQPPTCPSTKATAGYTTGAILGAEAFILCLVWAVWKLKKRIEDYSEIGSGPRTTFVRYEAVRRDDAMREASPYDTYRWQDPASRPSHPPPPSTDRLSSFFRGTTGTSMLSTSRASTHPTESETVDSICSSFPLPPPSSTDLTETSSSSEAFYSTRDADLPPVDQDSSFGHEPEVTVQLASRDAPPRLPTPMLKIMSSSRPGPTSRTDVLQEARLLDAASHHKADVTEDTQETRSAYPSRPAQDPTF